MEILRDEIIFVLLFFFNPKIIFVVTSIKQSQLTGLSWCKVWGLSPPGLPTSPVMSPQGSAQRLHEGGRGHPKCLPLEEESRLDWVGGDEVVFTVAR